MHDILSWFIIIILCLLSWSLYYRLNGASLIDEDYLRSAGVTDFTKYRCDPGSEPPRMMPRQFPDLTVAEEDKVGPGIAKL